jgi:tripartite-type tricarboxylate transporter receptor subunit TctC
MANSKVSTILFSVGLTLSAIGAAFAQNAPYPSKTIQLIVPFPPGASTDLAARFLGPKLQAALGQTVIVENRAGAGGIIGSNYVAKAAPDGYTLLVASSSVIVSPLLQRTPAYDPGRDLAPIVITFHHPFVMVANKDLPPRSLAELIAYAKANPGKLNFATLGSINDLMSEMFNKAANVKIELVRYRGAAENMVGVIRGDSHLTFSGYSVVQGQIANGDLHVIGVSSLRRSPLTPTLPTLAEQGLPGFEIINVIGIMAPTGTPQPILQRLNTEIARIMTSPEAKEFLNVRGNEVADDTSREAYADYIKKDTEKFRQIIEAAGIQKQ